jgi:hypothetical protein
VFEGSSAAALAAPTQTAVTIAALKRDNGALIIFTTRLLKNKIVFARGNGRLITSA